MYFHLQRRKQPSRGNPKRPRLFCEVINSPFCMASLTHISSPSFFGTRQWGPYPLAIYLAWKKFPPYFCFLNFCVLHVLLCRNQGRHGTEQSRVKPGCGSDVQNSLFGVLFSSIMSQISQHIFRIVFDYFIFRALGLSRQYAESTSSAFACQHIIKLCI